VLVASSLSATIGTFAGEPPSAAAQAGPGADPEIASLVQTWVAPAVPDGGGMGAAVAVIRDGKSHFFNFGVRNEAGDPVTSDTIFEIGSVTKVFTTALLGMAVNAGRMNLDDGIAQYLPDVSLRPRARQVTLLELADFTSGLPDDPPDLPRRLEMRGVEHYTAADLMRFFESWEPETLPAPYRYSNIGVGLLGILIARHEGRPWPELVREKITGPLGMGDTGERVREDARPRLARGHRPNGEPAPPWPIYAWAPAGALRSTARDLARFVAASLNEPSLDGVPIPAELRAGIALAQRPVFRMPNGATFQALAWVVRPFQAIEDNPLRIVFKDGGTDGFSAWVGVNPGKRAGAVLLINGSGRRPGEIGMKLIGHMAP
jgi:CubicO group peptidase (beta-lactamase class C family)